MNLFGRRKIYTVEEKITEANVCQVVNSALQKHLENVAEIEYLDKYRKGRQPILDKKKEIRPEINHKIVINNANFVVTFKNGYFLTKPCSYLSRQEDKEKVELVKQLNEYLYRSGKAHADNEAVDWFHTVGVGVIYVKPNDDPDVPYVAYSLDPRSAFCVYSRNPGNDVVMGVNYVTVDKNTAYIDVITKDTIYRVDGASVNGFDEMPVPHMSFKVVEVKPNLIGEINMIEYIYNKNRMSAFEPAIGIMDEINETESDRADSRTQFIQNLLVAVNTTFEEGTTANTIRQSGMICIKSVNDSKAEIKTISEHIDEAATQVTLDNLYNQMLEKCGVPSSVRDAGSTSDNVGAVYLRSGWAAADTDCRNEEDLFRISNARFDRVSLAILQKKGYVLGLKPTDFELCFFRNDMTNLQAKTQAALAMKQLGFSPELAFEKSGLSNDPISDVERSGKYISKAWDEDGNAKNVDPGQE